MKNSINYSALFLIVFALIFSSSCNKSDEPLSTGNRVGNLAPDFSLENENGQLVNLSDYKGQFVLVKFVASWCGYCKAEFPELNLIYEEYHSKSFEIISLSIDEDYTSWLKMIKDYNLQYVCVNDPKGFNSPLVSTYGVESIPRMYLVNREGVILLITTKADAVREALDKRL